MSARTDRYPLMDALRAIAALAVLGTHVAYPAGAVAPGTEVGAYVQRLDVGVTVFFLISAFLLYRPFARARILGTDPPVSGPYAWRRLLRIVPAYWVALILSALWLSKREVFTAGGVPTYFGFGQIYRESTIGLGLGQAWSLCIEVAFYAFLPVFAWLMRRVPGASPSARLRQELWALGGLLAFSLLYKALVLGSGSATQVRISPVLLSFPAYLDHFAVGMALAVVTIGLAERAPNAAPPRAVAFLRRAPTVPWLVALVAFWAVSTQLGIGDEPFAPLTPGQYLGRHVMYAVIAFGLMLPAVFCLPTGKGLVVALLRHPALGFLGLISYGIFLWNPTVIALLGRWDLASFTAVHPYVVWPVAAVAGTALLATVSYHLVERPAVRLGRSVGTPAARRPPPGDVLAEPAP